MFNPTITKEWLLATMDLEGDGFVNAGGIRSETLEDDKANAPSGDETLSTLKPKKGKEKNARTGSKGKRCTKNRKTA